MAGRELGEARRGVEVRLPGLFFPARDFARFYRTKAEGGRRAEDAIEQVERWAGMRLG